MASCRCGEIQNVRSKISVLGSAQGRLQNMSARRNQLKTKLSALSSQVQEGFASSEMSSLKTEIEALDDRLDGAYASFGSKVGNKKNELSNYLSSLESEDSQYHREEEERKQREAEEAKRQQELAAQANKTAAGGVTSAY